MIVLPGGGYAEHAPHEAEPVAETYRPAWLIGARGQPCSPRRARVSHGPHSLGPAQDAGEAAIWTTLANAWIHEQAAPAG
jgi:hypothetical protein